MSNLNIIDFSDGIRSEEIQQNFEILQDEINRERINVGGTGIASGLNITPIVDDNNFAIKVSEASIITKDGEEIYIEEQIIDIPRPYLTEQKEYLIADKENKITLNEIPYSLDRTKPVQYCDSYSPAYSGIEINYTNSLSTDDGIRVKNISNTTLTLTGLVKRSVEVKYYSTAKRIDTVYIDNDNKLQVKVSSITSSTPSAILPSSYKYLIAYIEIDNEYKASKSDIPHAYITIKEDLRTMRNIYTDKDGTLYLCGISFDDLQLIATKEPLDPKENQLWLNIDNNTLYIYKKVNNFSYIKTLEVTTEYQDGDIRDYTTDMTYRVNQGELSVSVNGKKLTQDEYAEMFNGLPAANQNITTVVHSNTFRVYKSLYKNDKLTYCINYKTSEMMWVPINKESYVNAKETKIYGIDEEWPGGNYWKTEQAVKLGTDENGYPLKYKIFLFDSELDRKMLFTPNRNEVEILINQMPLHKDQFIELTLGNVLEYVPEPVYKLLIQDYGWTHSDTINIYEDYENLGIGIMLVEPLDAIYNESVIDYPDEPILNWEEYMNMNGRINEEELYVEINVNRAVADTPSKRKLQRIATYVNENTVEVKDSNDVNINIEKGFYRYDENQLEVFLNGIKLTNKIDYEEGTDLGEPDEEKLIYKDYLEEFYNSFYYRNKGVITRRFTMKRNIQQGDVITYRITSTYYSYDHINNLLDEIELTYEECKGQIDVLYQESLDLNESTNTSISEMRDQISELIGNSTIPEDKFLTRTSIIGEDQIDKNVLNRIPQSINFINCKIEYKGTNTIDVTSEPYNIRNKDYITVIRRDNTNTGGADRFLIREEDYTIEDSIVNDSYFKTYLILKDSFLTNINNGDHLIISGIRFEREIR